MTNKIAIFKGKKIRKIIYQNEWWFSVVDVAQALTDQLDDYTARKYWNKLAQRLREEGSEVVTFCHQLKLQSSDGKMRKKAVILPGARKRNWKNGSASRFQAKKTILKNRRIKNF